MPILQALAPDAGNGGEVKEPDDDLTGSELRILLERIASALEGILDVKLHRGVIRREMQRRRGKRGFKKGKNPNDGSSE